MAKKEKKTVAEIITQRFIDALTGGQVPWIRPWEQWTSWSRATGNDYRGANQLTLYCDRQGGIPGGRES